jgi:hypothetical protein
MAWEELLAAMMSPHYSNTRARAGRYLLVAFLGEFGNANNCTKGQSGKFRRIRADHHARHDAKNGGLTG